MNFTGYQYPSSGTLLREFIIGFNKRMAGYYIENQSGTKLGRPELNKLIEDSEAGDALLIEKMIMIGLEM